MCLQRFSPFHSCLCRFELLPHCYLSHLVCRWFENHQRRLYADPKIRTAQHRLCEAGLMMTGTFPVNVYRKKMWEFSSVSVSCHLIPGEGAVDWVCVLEVVCLFHLADFVFHSKPLLHKGLVTDHNLQILHHLTGCVYVYVLIVISGRKPTAKVMQ